MLSSCFWQAEVTGIPWWGLKYTVAIKCHLDDLLQHFQIFGCIYTKIHLCQDNSLKNTWKAWVSNCRMQLLSTEGHNPPVRQPEYAFRRAVIIMSRKTRESPINYSPPAISPPSPHVSHLFPFTRGSWYATLRPSVQPKRGLKMLSGLICSKRGKYSHNTILALHLACQSPQTPAAF